MTAAPFHSAGLGRLWRLTRKELSESLRDRRTLGTLVLMPVLLYPLLAMAFLQLQQSSRVDEIRPLYRIGFVSDAEKDSVLEYWNIGRYYLRDRHAPSKVKGKEPELSPYLSPVPELDPDVPADLNEAVSNGRVDVGIRLHPGGGVRANRGLMLYDCDFIYRQGSNIGREAIRYLELLTADANAQMAGGLLRANGILARGDPVRARASTVPDLTPKKSQVMPVLVPLILILMTMTGAVYPAIDLTAGERERGTLEILIASPVPRLVLLFAKYAAVFTVAMLTALVNLGSMTLSLRITGIEKAVFESNLSAMVLMQVLGLLLLFAAFFSAVVLTVTSFARSFKEAQAYLIPLMLLCLTPGMMALLPDLKLQGPLAVVPLLNIVLLARDLLGGTANIGVAIIVVATTLLYAVAAVSLAARVFGAEAVLSSDVSGWSDLLRRPRNPRSAAEPASALLCLALMFPCYFLLMTGVAQIEGLALVERLALSAIANVLLFAGFPFVFSWMGRVRLADGLRCHVPSWSACAAAVLLGACLWPFVQEIILFQRAAGIGSVHPEYLKKVQEFLEQCRQHSPVLIVTALALVPAIVEELFFRGFLFTALDDQGRRPLRAVVATSALFATFHLLVSNTILWERLLPSFLMGVVLAWLCWRSGSVVPGIILHALHNGVLTLMGYYEPRLLEWGWLPATEVHLPVWLIGAAGAGALLGLAWVWRMRPRGRDREMSLPAHAIPPAGG